MSTILGISAGSLGSAFASGQAGLAASNQQLAQDAQQIADPNAAGIDAALLDSSQTLLLAQAAASIIKTADQMLGTLLDTYA
jgi:hypothetical protein